MAEWIFRGAWVGRGMGFICATYWEQHIVSQIDVAQRLDIFPTLRKINLGGDSYCFSYDAFWLWPVVLL